MMESKPDLIFHLSLFIANELAGNNNDPDILLDTRVLNNMINLIEDNNLIYVDSHDIPISTVVSIDYDEVDVGIVRIKTIYDETYTASGFDAYRIIMERAPHNMEGRRLHWAKHAWAFHNIVAHPLMQILVWLGFRKLAMRVHDKTQPIPIDVRNDLRHY